MIERRCARCQTPLIRKQTRYCTHRCVALDTNDRLGRQPKRPRRQCLRTSCSRWYSPRRQSHHYCSLSCAVRATANWTWRRPSTATELVAVAELFEGNWGWWLTYSDIAIWRYGDDTDTNIAAARHTVQRLRQSGYRFAERVFPWPNGERTSIKGFRLLSVPQVAREEVA